MSQSSRVLLSQEGVERSIDAIQKGEPAALGEKNLEWEGGRRLNNVEGRLVREIFSCSRLLLDFSVRQQQIRIDCSFGKPGKPLLLVSATTFKERQHRTHL